MATPDGFARNPELVHAFYNARPRKAAAIRQSGRIRRMRRWRGWNRSGRARCSLVTQNIDDLHERAGSRNLLHMHGELYKVRCDALRSGDRVARRPRPRRHLSRLRRCWQAAAARRLVRRDADRDGRRFTRRCDRCTSVHVDRHVGARLPGGGIRQPRPDVHAGPYRRVEPGAVLRRQHICRRPCTGLRQEVVPVYIDALLAGRHARLTTDADIVGRAAPRTLTGPRADAHGPQRARCSETEALWL